MLPASSLSGFERAIERARIERARAYRAFFRRAGRAALRAPGAVLAWAAAALRGLAVWHRRRMAVRELQRLDDRMLKDIGLYRGEIWQAADMVAHGLEPVRRAAPKPAPAEERPEPAPAAERPTPAPAAEVLRLPPIYTGARAA